MTGVVQEDGLTSVSYTHLVVVSGGIKKYVIVARALKVKINGKEQFFDYAACAYPEGMVGDRLMSVSYTHLSCRIPKWWNKYIYL